MKLTVLVTCFNEKATIRKAIEEARNIGVEKEIIVVDNGSTDGTREILMELDDGSMNLVFQPKNFGFGQSMKTGMALANGEYVYVQFSDLEYDVNCVYRMLDVAEREKLDAVFGSRLFNVKKNIVSVFKLIKQRPYYLGTLITTFLTNIFYRRKFTDIIGSKFYRTSSFRQLGIEATDISFDFEFISKACKQNFKIKEVPVSYKPRTAREGKKVKALDILPAITAMFKVKFGIKQVFRRPEEPVSQVSYTQSEYEKEAVRKETNSGVLESTLSEKN